MKKSVSARWYMVSAGWHLQSEGRCANVFKVLQEVGDSLPLVLGKDILVEGIAGLAWVSKLVSAMTISRADPKRHYLRSMRSCRYPWPLAGGGRRAQTAPAL